MVIEKFDTLESSLRNVLEELTELRRSREKLESEIAKAREEARSASQALNGRDGEIHKLRKENDRLQKEKNEVRDRVKRILHHFTNG